MAEDTSQADIPEGGPYAPGPNRYTGGGTNVDTVTPIREPDEEADEQEK